MAASPGRISRTGAGGAGRSALSVTNPTLAAIGARCAVLIRPSRPKAPRSKSSLLARATRRRQLEDRRRLRSVPYEVDTTQLLVRSRAGDGAAAHELLPRVYEELRRVAHARLARQRSGDTLNTTALVHEAYLKLVDGSRVEWQDRAHFIALASRAMRFILVDYARARTAARRGGGQVALPLDEARVAADASAADLVDLHEALERLTAADERLGRLVEYRFFGGMTHEEIAEVTGLSVPTVKRDWRRARAWLFREMRDVDTLEK